MNLLIILSAASSSVSKSGILLSSSLSLSSLPSFDPPGALGTLGALGAIPPAKPSLISFNNFITLSS